MYEDEEDFESAKPPGGSKKSLGRKLSNALIALLILSLLAVVVYLRSDINSRTYFIVPEEGQLNIMKGRFLPMGVVEFQSTDPLFAAAYAPIKIPRFAAQQVRESFSERAELDQVLAGRLLSWSRTLVDRDNRGSIAKAISYLERMNLLPVTSMKQKLELEELYREVAFFQGRESLRSAQSALKESLSYFERATEAKEKISRRARHATKILKQMALDLGRVVKVIDNPKLTSQTSSTSSTAR